MTDITLSVFVDESGRFQFPDVASPFKPRAGLWVEFAQAVTPERYKLFQLADMIATLKLVELKLSHGEPMTSSEFKFFGGPRKFKNNYLRFVKPKEI